ncbi:hypothetical protein J4421_03945 [Candidatus Woesearchaeota archaeon]|nr:hypothetical protein [Candidatus Woesearchaeota archaeon]
MKWIISLLVVFSILLAGCETIQPVEKEDVVPATAEEKDLAVNVDELDELADYLDEDISFQEVESVDVD